MDKCPTILFLCPHHAATSLLAAADCRIEAERRGLSVRIETAGTEPASGPMPSVVAALLADGVDVSDHRPRHVAPDELAAARWIVSMGCDLTDLAPHGVKVEHWHDVPPASADVVACRAAIHRRLTQFLDDITAERAALDRWENEGGAA